MLINGMGSGEPRPDLERGRVERAGTGSSLGGAISAGEGRGARFDLDRGRMGIRDGRGSDRGTGGDTSELIPLGLDGERVMVDFVRVRGAWSLKAGGKGDRDD